MLLWGSTAEEVVPSTVGNILHSIRRNVLTSRFGRETCQRRSLEPQCRQE
jgi:hypothetical protein